MLKNNNDGKKYCRLHHKWGLMGWFEVKKETTEDQQVILIDVRFKYQEAEWKGFSL